jgi:sec-independent protein translocase protein TatA
MGELFTPPHLIVVAVVALVVFGGRKLPEFGKGLGEGLRGFRDGLRGKTELSDMATPSVAAQIERDSA